MHRVARLAPFAAAASLVPATLLPSPTCDSPSRFSASLARHKQAESATRARWIKDEENWRKLPARAWPPAQPDEDALPACEAAAVAKCGGARDKECLDAEFLLATCRFFTGADPVKGFAGYKRNAEAGHLDSMVGVGVCLTENYIAPADAGMGEAEAVAHLRRAAELGSLQATFELGVLYYTGTSDSVPADERMAAACFEKAARQGHTAAQYMVADMITEGEGGLERDFVRALDLFYAAAEKGHRFSRQQFLACLDGRHKLCKLANR
ncbi:hypothetical protein TeGR_g14810 [Tetraparma gracilis]|uniref:Sel1 repeat family protein n=1 Tax=Tetraparma gracilis TaxID=2962635 RepID=A0ABQ6MTU7_9STRA|nr:hypothetical protein TeGR_g14810 [Tetraparma gracilis]